MDSFLFVLPTGAPLHRAPAAWLQSSLSRATNEWRAQFRGLVPIKNDTDVTRADIAANNLILWGDPRGNKVLGQILRRLPLEWNAKEIRIGRKRYDSAGHIPMLIYPNPLNPNRYVVLNSCFTFAQFGAGSNSQQTPKLPDWAVLDLNIPFSDRLNGKGVVDANFFTERWELERGL